MSNKPTVATKPSLIDRVIEAVSPSTALRRRAAREAARAYDGAMAYQTSDWTSASYESANSELRVAQHTLRNRSRDMVRNSPHAKKALAIVVNNTVGAGILAHIYSQDSRQQAQVQALWKKWAETTLCDFNGQQNFYAMQALAMASVVESGDVLCRERISRSAVQLQLLESDYLNVNRDSSVNLVQGVQISDEGVIQGYWLYERHPGDYRTTAKDNFIPASQVSFIRRIERPGQIRGVTWFHPVLEGLNAFNDLQAATLVRIKVAACLMGFITAPEASADSVIAQAQLNAQRQQDSQFTPGAIKYLRSGEKFEHSSPPQVEGYEAFSKVTLRGIAAGLGVTYEGMTGDLSNTNFSSLRAGNLEFQRSLDMWRWHMLIPQFCEPAWASFSKWCAIQGVSTDGCTVDWRPPARTMVDPVAETSAIKEQLRMGLTTLQRAVSETGYDYRDTMAEISQANKDMDDAGIILDGDPRKVTQQGMVQLSDPTQLAAVTAHALEPKPAPAAPQAQTKNAPNAKKA